MRVRTFLAILTIILGIKANATNYYFSSSQGDDSRSSTQAQSSSTPWKSIDKLNSFFSNIKPGDQILFKCGDIFYGAISTNKSGTSSAPITFSSYGSGSKPVISGLTTITSWTSLGNGIFESNALPTGSQLNMVIINGKEYAMGRYPNASSSNGGYLTFESHGYKYINDNENTLTSSWNGAQLVVRTSHWTIERSTISNISGTTISYSNSFDMGLTDKYGYFIQNSIKTLDQFGEWYYNPDTKKIAVYFGSSTPSGNTVQVSTKDIVMTLENGYLVLNNLTVRGANTYGIWGSWANATNLTIKKCRVEFSGLDGICMGNRRDFVMDSSVINYSNSVGICLSHLDYNPIIKNCTFQNTGTFPGMLQEDVGNRYAMGIYSTEGLTATNNKILNTGYIGIMFTGSNNLIQNNLVDTFCTVVDDGGGIYTGNYTPAGQLPPTVHNRKIIGNIVLHGIGAKAGSYERDPNYLPAEGIYLDDNTMNVDVLNNTAAYCADAGIYIHNTSNFNIIGNVLYNNKYMQLGFEHGGTAIAITGGLIKRNQLFAQTASQYVLRMQSINNDMANAGSFDSNYYCRPSNEDRVNYTNWHNNKENWYNLSGWQNGLNKDWHTKKTPVSVPDSSYVLFQYNASTSTKTITLGTTYVGLDGKQYSGSVKLAPYTSIILLKSTSSNVSGKTTTTAAAITNTAISGPGYVNTESASLTVKAYPNPSSYYFNVTTQGGSISESMTLRVIDLSGKVVQVKTGIASNSTLQIGQDLAPGSYILELIQGNKKVEQKLIKLSK